MKNEITQLWRDASTGNVKVFIHIGMSERRHLCGPYYRSRSRDQWVWQRLKGKEIWKITKNILGLQDGTMVGNKPVGVCIILPIEAGK